MDILKKIISFGACTVGSNATEEKQHFWMQDDLIVTTFQELTRTIRSAI